MRTIVYDGPMKTHAVITSAILSAFMLAVLACGDTKPLPDIDATVKARVTEERAVEATVQAKAQTMAKAIVQATVEAASTMTPIPLTPTATPVPPTLTPAADEIEEGSDGRI